MKRTMLLTAIVAFKSV